MDKDQFSTKFRNALREMIPMDHDGYVEIPWSENIVVHVWSLDSGADDFEIEVCVPLSSGISEDTNQLGEFEEATEFIDTVGELLTEETGEDFTNLAFYLMESYGEEVHGGAHNAYVTHTLTAEDYAPPQEA